jgi:hypothetical protein
VPGRREAGTGLDLLDGGGQQQRDRQPTAVGQLAGLDQARDQFERVGHSLRGLARIGRAVVRGHRPGEGIEQRCHREPHSGVRWPASVAS